MKAVKVALRQLAGGARAPGWILVVCIAVLIPWSSTHAVVVVDEPEYVLENCILDRLEALFPAFFHPQGAVSSINDGLVFRYYSGSNAFTAVFTGILEPYTNKVLYYGPLFPGVLLTIGDVQWLGGYLGCQ